MTSAVTSATTPDAVRHSSWRAGRVVLTIVVVWAVIATILCVHALTKADGVSLYGDNAMRMVTAEQLLGGQGWQDLNQYRDNTPYGVTLHWSRLLDAPLAVLLASLRPFVGPAAAVDIVGVLWPTLLLLPALALSVALVRRLVPEAGPLTPLALVLVSIVGVLEFLPGRTDHHNVQMLLTLAAALLLLTARELAWGAVAIAAASATSLAIGLETLPLVAATIATYSLLWLADPSRLRRPLVLFGSGLALATLGHFFAATPPEAYFSGACDMLSDAYVIPIVAGGLGLAAIAALASNLGFLPRLALLALGGGATIALWIVLNPPCLAGPYAMNELLSMEGYFELILEAQPLLAVFAENPANAMVYAGAILVASALTVGRIVASNGTRRTDWLIVGAFLLVSVIIMFLQLRGVRLAALFALPASAWLISRARHAYLARTTLPRAGALVGSWLLLSSAAHVALLAGLAALTPGVGYAAMAPAVLDARESCISRASYDRLAGLEPGRLMAPFNLGPNLLLYTPHSIVSAGFHRNIEGTRDVIAFFSGDEQRAQQIIATRGIDYVVVCTGYPDYDGAIGHSPAEPWDWLTPLSAPDESLQVYRAVR